MDPIAKLKALTDQMTLEPSEEHRAIPEAIGTRKQDICIQPAQMPGGKQILLLKTLLTSVCERNCFYCPFRAGRDFRRATFRPEEFANLFLSLANSKAAEGIFLSSGVAGGGVRSQDQLLATADILRNKLGFKGYIHLLDLVFFSPGHDLQVDIAFETQFIPQDVCCGKELVLTAHTTTSHTAAEKYPLRSL